MEPEIKTIITKPFKIVVLEGSIYFILGAFPPIITYLQSTEPLTARSVTALVFASLLAGGVALKAFFSQSNSATKPTPP